MYLVDLVVENYNSQAMDTSPPRLFPRSVPNVKLIIPQGYIQGNMVIVCMVWSTVLHESVSMITHNISKEQSKYPGCNVCQHFYFQERKHMFCIYADLYDLLNRK